MRGIGIKIEVIKGENAMLVNRHFRSLIPCLEKMGTSLPREIFGECFDKTQSGVSKKTTLEYVLGKLRQRQTSKLQ